MRKFRGDLQIFHRISQPDCGLSVVLKPVGFLGSFGKEIFFEGLRTSCVALSFASGAQ
jgi:hypothetical protein